jgi:LmbE family N-acetylglucosaminyl deacetylase
MNPYHQMVAEYNRLAREGRGYPLGRFPRCPRPQIAPTAPKALLFSPHPDDEVIVGALPLRLLRKSKWNVINVAVTLGSNPERRAGRLAELKACCDCVGFGLLPAAPNGLDRVNPAARRDDPAAWAESVKVIAEILGQHAPRVIFFPHAADWNSTHEGTHHLVLDALARQSAGFACHLVETEFWQPMTTPNLMVEVSLDELGDLITALSFHVGEVQRNPYHLTLPGWMVDNVRRGGELVGGQGKAAPDFSFATLYRVSRWAGGAQQSVDPRNRILDARHDPAEWFAL